MNLLTPATKEALARTIRARFLLTGSIVFSAVACAGILALLPALLLAHAPQAELTAATANATTTAESDQMKADRENALHTRTLLTELLPLAQPKRSTSETIAGIYGLRPPGITISNIVYSGNKSGMLTLSGNASNRDAINAFRNSLTESGRFDNVSVPVAALVGALEGRFTITLTGTF